MFLGPVGVGRHHGGGLIDKGLEPDCRLQKTPNHLALCPDKLVKPGRQLAQLVFAFNRQFLGEIAATLGNFGQRPSDFRQWLRHASGDQSYDAEENKSHEDADEQGGLVGPAGFAVDLGRRNLYNDTPVRDRQRQAGGDEATAITIKLGQMVCRVFQQFGGGRWRNNLR